MAIQVYVSDRVVYYTWPSVLRTSVGYSMCLCSHVEYHSLSYQQSSSWFLLVETNVKNVTHSKYFLSYVIIKLI